MCGTQALSNIGMATTALGTYQQMKATQQQANYDTAIANQNANIAQQQSVAAGQAGAQEQSQIRQKERQVAGSQKAQLSSNGLDISSGSPLDLLTDTAQQSQKDVDTSRYNTAINMWGYDTQTANYRAQAQAAKQAGKNARTSTLLTGLTSLAKQYQGYKSTI